MFNITIQDVLIECNEPLLVLGTSRKGKKYLCIAIENDEYRNPYLTICVTDVQLEALLAGELDVKSAFVKPSKGIWYIADIEGDLGKVEKFKNNFWDIPPEYIPGSGLLLDDGVVEDGIMRQVGSNVIRIDGRWTPTDFQQINRTYNQIYSFSYLIENGDAAMICNRVIAHPYRDGFSSMHLHRELLSGIPSFFRPHVKEVKYASPGHIKISGKSNSVGYFMNVAKILKFQYDVVLKVYSECHDYLTENRLIGIEVSSFSGQLITDHGDALDAIFIKLCRTLSIDHANVDKFADANKLGKVKYMMMIIRRMDEMRSLIFSEKIIVE